MIKTNRLNRNAGPTELSSPAYTKIRNDNIALFNCHLFAREALDIYNVEVAAFSVLEMQNAEAGKFGWFLSFLLKAFSQRSSRAPGLHLFVQKYPSNSICMVPGNISHKLFPFHDNLPPLLNNFLC
jgi:hypothetical protein